jgi:hypothetical protein
MTEDKTKPHLSERRDQANAEHVGQQSRQTQTSWEPTSNQPAARGRKPLFRN